MKPGKSKPSLLSGITTLCLGLIFTLSACSTTTRETATPEQVAVYRPSDVIATGEVVPKQEALLSLSTGGVVEDVLVKKGDKVSAGQVLVQLEGTAQQLAAVSIAELELANARYALDALYKDTDLIAAQALRSAEEAEEALEDLYNRELQKAIAMQTVAGAEQALEDAERNLAILTKRPTQAVIDQAYANMLLAENKLNKILEDIEDTEWQLKKYSWIPSLAKMFRQALRGLEVQRTQDQLAYNNSKTKYNNLLEPPDPIDVALAEAELATAQASLLEAERDLERVMDGPDAGEVALLEAQIEKGTRDHETYRAGPDPDDVALAEARIANAEAQLEAAKSILADLVLEAPFDGVISEVYIDPSEWVALGSPVLLIADTEHLQVETTDLSEIDVAKISEGDPVTVTFDALPDLELQGTVSRIAPKAAAGPGVNFPVIIELSEIPDKLRWGMTAFVDIDLE
jgi:HlyD family secretion protein